MITGTWTHDNNRIYFEYNGLRYPTNITFADASYLQQLVDAYNLMEQNQDTSPIYILLKKTIVEDATA